MLLYKMGHELGKGSGTWFLACVWLGTEVGWYRESGQVGGAARGVYVGGRNSRDGQGCTISPRPTTINPPKNSVKNTQFFFR